MARRKPVARHEKAIGDRICSFREGLGVTRVAVARLLGVTPTRLRSYEEGRVPIRFGIADRFCRHYNVSQEWLATGAGEPSGFLELGATGLAQVKDSAAFTEVFHGFLARHFERRRAWKTAATNAGLRISYDQNEITKQLGVDSHEIAYREAKAVINGLISNVPPRLWPEFCAALVRAAQDFLNRNSPAVADYVNVSDHADSDRGAIDQLEPAATKLDTAPDAGYLSITAMKNLWQPWQKRLAKVCETAGTRARLAREFKVSRQGASNWVAGVSEPTADYALHLIGWIKAEEAKAK